MLLTKYFCISPFARLKVALLIQVLLFFLVLGETKSQISLDRGLIGCYTFSGNAQDLSGSGNHGTVNGARLTSDRFGKPDNAYDFDGRDDYIELSAEGLKLNQFSYSIWVYPKQLPAPGEAMFLISVGSDYGDQHILLGDHYSNSRHTGFSHGSYQGVGDNVDCSGHMPVVNRWYHLALVKDNTHYTLYVNGNIICRENIQNRQAFYGTGTVRAVIGARNNYGQASNVMIDDVHLYDRALTSAEVEALYNGPDEIPLPVDLVFNNVSPCGGTSLTINASSPAGVSTTYKWFVNGTELAGQTDQELVYQLPEEKAPYSMTFSVQVSSENTCFPYAAPPAEKKLEVQACSSVPETPDGIIIPNAFTPNGDGINDTWKITLGKTYSDLSIIILNRWGEVIFQSGDPNHSWDGTYSGRLVQSGLYVFIIRSGAGIIKEGALSILY